MKRVVSKVEQSALQRSGEKPIYSPREKIATIIVENFPALGKLVALRFIEWAQQNPGWTISLPTGKTPEHFIKWVTNILKTWHTKKTTGMLEDNGVDPAKKPDMKSFHFIQIDEFYPINSWQHNSFYFYVNKYYLDGFGLDPKKALLINPNAIGLSADQKLDDIWPDNIVDLTLRTRYPMDVFERRRKQVLEAVDQFCTEYERTIRALGGIGFFLGGIGPDGHIGFNVQGSDHYSTTRLTATNYETQAAAATDLGGIEVSRNRLVITIGLQTMVHNLKTTAIIMAAGEAKAAIIKKAIESEQSNDVPASVLQELPNATFYITRGAAKLLVERRSHTLANSEDITLAEKIRIVTDLALEKKKKIVDLREDDFNQSPFGKVLLQKDSNHLPILLEDVERDYQQRILNALHVHRDETFLHTAPHHDDIMLGYLPYLVRLMRDPSNRQYFNYLTSGFNAVSNNHVLQHIDIAGRFIKTADFQRLHDKSYFNPANAVFRYNDVLHYLDGLAADSEYEMEVAMARRFLRNLVEIYQQSSRDDLQRILIDLKVYFHNQYPGAKDRPEIQKLKGMIREWEADIKWGYFGYGTDAVIHSRLGFYTGDIFTEEPEIDRDVMPVLQTLKRVKPTVVTVALDPEGSGPDTHYKVLQAISSALKLYREEFPGAKITIWGYRNVWYRYHPSEANLFIPVTLNGMAILKDVFLNAFRSQAEASFPSYEYDGPFSGLAKKIHVEQYQFMRTVLGSDFFYRNPDSRIRSTRGLIYLKVMELDEFFTQSRDLRKKTEDL
ncbi:MAG TPA: glucosamine-6-phosphate deaminase [bacterium]